MRLLIVLLLSSPVTYAQQAPLRLNQIQVIGTHNSYHAGLTPGVAKALQLNSPRVFDALDYSHPSLAAQLDAGVRQLEIDVFADSKGGLYAHPAMESKAPTTPPYNAGGVMDKPGFKVMHVQDIDQRSNCEPLRECLEEVRAWSRAHPRHMPLFLLIETKQSDLEAFKLGFPTVHPEPFTPAVFDQMDAEIRSVFQSSEMVVPDDVRASYATLNAAVLAGHWPALEFSRGKVVFLMDQRAMEPVYTTGHPSLEHRILFTNAVPGAPDAAFTEMNDGPVEKIHELVRQGYLVRARTDSDTRQARTNDTTVRDGMIGSGAQILSTDYPANEPARWPGRYSVQLPEGVVARCNPVNAPTGCVVGDGPL